jgi:excisionase family DNA binding protein
LLTSAEAALRLGVSTRTIARRAASGDLPFVRKLGGVRGGYLFDSAVVDLYLRRTRRPLRVP